MRLLFCPLSKPPTILNSLEHQKKFKRGRKRKTTASGDDAQDTMDKKGNAKRKHKAKSLKDDTSREDKKHKHKSHHHHSKKGDKRKSESGNTKEDGNQSDKMAKDIECVETTEGEARSKRNKDEVMAGDGSSKKVKKPRSKKSCILRGDQTQKHQSSDRANDKEPKSKSYKDEVKPKAKKVKEPSIKKADTSTEIKDKQPRVKKASNSKPKTDNSTKTSEEDTSKTKLTVDKNASVPKTKRSKKDAAAPKMKPTFKSPSKNMKGTIKEMKKTSFTVPMLKKIPPAKKEQKEQSSKGGAADNTTIQESDLIIRLGEGSITSLEKISIKEFHPIPDKLIKPDTSTNKASLGETSKTTGKANKFSIKKKNTSEDLTSVTPTSSSKMDGDPSKKDGNPSKNADPETASRKSSNDKPEKQVKKKAPKKFSIKQKNAIMNDLSSATPALPEISDELNMTDSNVSKDGVPATSTVTPCTNKAEKPPKISVPKKFSIKRKPSTTNASIEVKDDHSQYQPKKMDSRNQEEQQKHDMYSDHELHLNLEESSIMTDITMSTRKYDDEMNGDSDDFFSMEDLDDWPKDVETKDEPNQQDSTKFDQLTAGNDTNSQPFEIVEE